MSKQKSVAADPENEIVEELAEEVEQNGEVRFVTDEETIKREGALNAEAVQSNRRRKAVLNKKRGGLGNVPWNEGRAPLLYDDIIEHYPANTIMVYVERLTGTPASWYLYGQPKSGADLYQAVLRQCHGRREETEYRVVFRDAQKKFDRGIGRLTIPSTLDDATLQSAPQGLAMQNGIPPQSFHPQQQQQAPQFAQEGGYPVTQPAPGYARQDPLALMQQQLAESQRQVAELMRLVATSQGRPVPPPQPQAQALPGMLNVPGFGFVPVAKLVEALGVGVPAQGAPPPSPPKSPAEQFRESIGLITVAVDAARSMGSLLPAAAAAAGSSMLPPEEEESPVKTVKMGDMNLIVNKADGSTRLVETAIANGDKILNWLEKQRQTLQQQQQQAMGQMPTLPTMPTAPPAPATSMQMPQWPNGAGGSGQ